MSAKTKALGAMLVATCAITAGMTFDAPASAEPAIIGVPLRTCVTNRCEALNLAGRLAGSDGSNSWVIQLDLNTGKCFKAEVTSAPGMDLEMIVVAPGGVFFRDDDSGVGLNPRVVIANVSTNGIHTLVLQSFNGTDLSGNFNLAVAQYNVGNPNCATPTTGL